MRLSFREMLFKIWYGYISRLDKNAEILFMNYGYSSDTQKVELQSKDENNRYSIQLYHKLAAAIELKDKNIAEIGCGRGGGLAYISEYFKPKTAVGIDLNNQAIKFCNGHYKFEGLSYKQGNAQSIPLADSSCDAIINVESSHRYPDMAGFLKEVKRVLRPGGTFLFTGFREDYELDDLYKALDSCEMHKKENEMITDNVVMALDADDPRKRELIKRLAPKILYKTALNFASVKGSDSYNKFVSKKFVYFYYMFTKSL